MSVKNGAELLDRLVKDIVSESAASYVSVLDVNEKMENDDASNPSTSDLPMAFSLAKFIPLLEERIHVINPFTRTFLVSWLTLLDTIPDLELVYYLPAFLGGLFKFLGDPNRDVYVATQGLLERFLNEIKKIAKIKRSIAESRRSRAGRVKRTESQAESATVADTVSEEIAIADSDSGTAQDEPGDDADGDWIPGQDVTVDHAKILDILLKFVDVSSSRDTAPTFRLEGLSKQKEEEIGIVALRWIDSFFDVSPEDILQFVPRLLSQVLPALSAQSDQVRTTASRVNRSLMDYIMTLQGEPDDLAPSRVPTRDSQPSETEETADRSPSPQPPMDLDYAAAVSSLTLQFLNEHEETRVAALSWLIMLHRKAPKKVLAFNDGTFPALLKTLSDPAETVVTRDLQLLSQISKNSDDGYFYSFMVALLQLFSTDRKLLEIRGNLIIRQLCINLQPERIYRTLAEIIEKDEDIEFASIMVQNLNNNLITAPELAELRKRLRNLDAPRDNTTNFFATLFKAWTYNAVATFSLCLLAQSYEQAYHLLQIFADLEMTVNMLIQIDKLVQLLESPVFTYLRLQLLEPDRYPYLYKCLYGLLMLLPQSSAFAALKNRLNSVSAIGLLHTPASFPTPSPSARLSVTQAMSSAPNLPQGSSITQSSVPGRLNRTREPERGTEVRWGELLEKFRGTQEKARRRNERLLRRDLEDEYSAGLGGAEDGVGGGGGGAARRSLLELHVDTSSNSYAGPSTSNMGTARSGVGRADTGPTSMSSGRRPGSGLSKPLPTRPDSGLSNRGNGRNSMDSGRSLDLAGQGLGQRGVGGGIGGAGVAGAVGGAAGNAAEKAKSRHSLAGGLGKFASGIGRSGVSKERERGERKDKR